MSHRNWCFTWNNYTDEAERILSEYPCTYMVVGKEVGENGTPHLQGYVEFGGSKRLETLKNAWGNAPHFEPRMGTAKQASEYCKKDGNFTERGQISQQGKRSDLNEAAMAIMDKNVKIMDVIKENPKLGLIYMRRMKELRMEMYGDRKEAPKVIWLWGRTGVGKSRVAFDIHDEVYIKDGTHWWNGYEQQEAIVIDDFDGKWPFRDLLRLLDRYPYQGQTKGGYVKINSEYIYITCDRPPERFWPNGMDLEQIQRRITYIFELM